MRSAGDRLPRDDAGTRGGGGAGRPDPPEPPAAWRWALRRILSGSEGEYLVGELDLLFRRRVRRQGEAAARRWYRREVRACAVRLPLERTRRGLDTIREGGMGLGRSIRQATRRLARTPGFALVAATTFAIGIGATTVILGLADQALLRPLPYPEAERLVTVANGWSFSRANLEAFEERMTSLTAVGGARDAMGMTLESAGGEPSRVVVAEVTVGYLKALAVEPLAGRRFIDDEGRPGAGAVAMVAAGFARERFGSPAAALGREVTLDARNYTVVGVLPVSFDLPSEANQIWVPVEMDPDDAGTHWGSGAYSLVGRLAPGAEPAAVAREMAELGESLRRANPLWTPGEGYLAGAEIAPLAEVRSRYVRTPILILLGAVALLLLVVCANVANLLLSQGVARSRDHAVRIALGAGRSRMVVDQMIEVMVLALLGVGGGLALAWAGLEFLRPHLPAELPGRSLVGVDLRVLGLSAGVATLAALVAGALPALRLAGRAPGSLIASGGDRTRSGGRSRRRTTRLLVSGQLAAAVVLVVSAGLLGRSLVALRGVDPGFEAEERVTLRIDLAPGADPGAEGRALELAGLAAELRAAVGGAPVALASTLPFGGEVEAMATFIEGVTPDPNSLPVVAHHRVDPAWFEVMGIDLLQGRGFDAGDRIGSELVVVVDEAFVDRFLPEGDALGRIVRYPWRGAPDMRIVGVVEAVREGSLEGETEPTFFAALPQMQPWHPDHVFVVAPSVFGDAATTAALGRAARSFDDRVALSRELPYPALLGTSYASARIVAILMALVAAATLILGAVGVYGVASFWVRERVRDIGVRIALGAEPAKIRRQVFRQGIMLALPGGLLGLALAIPAARVLDGFLFSVSALDPLTLVAAPVLLSAAAMAAVYLPARRATRVDPVEVLKGE